MKKSLLTLSLIIVSTILTFAKTWTIKANGFSFSPSTLTIKEGDTVVFNISGHNALEIENDTWVVNGTSAKTNGFSVAFGGGTVLPNKLTPGTHYYICTPHASSEMKAQIIVEQVTSVENLANSYEFELFPNPTHDVINVKSTEFLENASYSILDQQSKCILKGTLENNNKSININALSKGLFFIIIEDKKGKSKSTFIKD